MKDSIVSLFSGVEIQKRQQIVALMSDWLSEIERKYEAEPDDELWAKGPPRSYFVADGFFPGYFNQKLKVLFIGRETRWTEGDYIESTIKGYNEENYHNKSAFTRRLLYIIQGIKHNGKLKFESLEEANYYAKEMVDTKDYGFAFMNISKYSNWKEDGGTADFGFINIFLEDSNLEKRNFFHEELEILEPDIIITMNLWDGNIERKYLDLCFGKIEWENLNDDTDDKVKVSSLILNDKSIKLINCTHHFSSIPRSISKQNIDKEFFYDPVMKAVFGK
jgi:hypothetical protein